MCFYVKREFQVRSENSLKKHFRLRLYLSDTSIERPKNSFHFALCEFIDVLIYIVGILYTYLFPFETSEFYIYEEEKAAIANWMPHEVIYMKQGRYF